MSIASEITRIKTNISNAYTKLEEKGATIPETKNSENLTACIDSVSVGGGGSATKYGVSIGSFLGDVDENGVLQKPNESIEIVATGILDIGANVLERKFQQNTLITKVNFSDLTTISSNRALVQCFDGCPNLTEAKFESLITISGYNCCYYAFQNCAKLETIDFANLTTISGDYACDNMFTKCTKLTSINFDNLTSITGSNSCVSMFLGCTGLTSVSFPKLTTVAKTNALGSLNANCIFYNCTNLTEIHFRADAQTVIEGLTAYQYNFGATNATIYFDL